MDSTPATVTAQFPIQLSMGVEPYLSGVRIDTFLARHLRSYTSWRLHRLVKAGQIQLNGMTAGPATRVHPRDVVSVRLLEPPDDFIPAEPIPLQVVYEDEWLIVLNKPAGLIVHPTGETPRGTMLNAAQHYLNQTAQFPFQFKPGIVHRLDRDTSGVVAIAKDHLSHRELSIQFQRERVAKTYVAIVEGRVSADEGMIDLPIGRVRGCSSALMTTRGDALDPRASRTAYTVIERLPRHTLVRVKPRTGRLHQIRVHFAALGHPVVGDDFYAAHGELKPPRRPPLPDGRRADPPISPFIPRHALHAEELSLMHPMTGTWITVRAPWPDDFEQALAAVRELGDNE